MPIVDGSYVAPTWVDDNPPAMDAAEMQALTDTVEANQNDKAPLASPAFTGTPTAPTAAPGDDSTQIANTEFVQKITLAAFPTDTASGNPAILDDGADGVPVKSVSATVSADYAVEPLRYLAVGTGTVGILTTVAQRCIVFPAAASTTYTVTSGLTNTMRIGSFTGYPKLGDTPTVYREGDNINSISLDTGASDKFVMVQFFKDDNDNPPDWSWLTTALGTGFSISPIPPAWEQIPVRRVGKNTYDLTTGLYAGRWDTGGSLNTASTGRRHTLFFRVKGGESYVWSVNAAYPSGMNMAWFDDKCSWISNSTLSSGNTSVVVTAPANAAYASLSLYTSTTWAQFERGTAASVYATYSEQSATLDLTDGTLDGALATVKGNNDFTAPAGSLSMEYRADFGLYVQKLIGG